MAVVTIYDDEISYWQDRLETAEDIKTLNEAKNKLLSLAVARWASVSSLLDLSTEIDSRLREYKDETNNKGITKTGYQRWKEVMNRGVDSDSYEFARNLLAAADQSMFMKLARKRNDYLTKYAEEQEDTVISGEGLDTVVSSLVNTVSQNDDGTFVINPTVETVTVKQDAVLSSNETPKGIAQQDPNYLDRRPAWVDTNIEYRRRKTQDGLLVDSAYIKRYYSVIDAELYFGNEYVEDVCDINWAIHQNTLPLFGYNSYTYDEIARGSRLISGNFTINFTSPNYLFSILEEANNANVISITDIANYTVPKLSDDVEPVINGSTIGTRERGHHAPMWPQTFDIDIIFGEKSGAGNPVHIVILGCAIQGSQMVLSASAVGSPPSVKENYSFIAKDIKTVVTANNDESNKDKKFTKVSGELDSVNTGDGVTEQDSETNNYSGTLIGETKDTIIRDVIDNTKHKEAARRALENGQRLATEQFNGNGDSTNVFLDPDVNKAVSNKETCELLARFSKIFDDINNVLTSEEQKKLALGIEVAYSKGEYFVVSSDEDSLLALRYTVEHNGELKACTTVVDLDGEILAALKEGKYYQFNDSDKPFEG